MFAEIRDEFFEIAKANDWIGNLISMRMGMTDFSFNGIDDDGHEDCYFDGKAGFNFCKTARKPYDIAVRVFLGLLKSKLKTGVKLSTDDSNTRIFSTAYKKYKLGT